MPTPIKNRLVRIRRVPFAPFASTQLIDVYTEQSAEVVRGNATRFEFGFFDSAGAALDLSDVESLNLKIQPSQTVDGVLADQTITEIDLTLDAESWEDGSKSHAVFEFTNGEMNIPPGGASRPLWVVVTAITATGGNEVTLCAGIVILHEDNNGSAASPPAFPGAYLTIDQGDARYGPPGSTAPVNGDGSMTVSGAGTEAANAVYLPWGTLDGKTAYSISGTDPSAGTENSIGWIEGYGWGIYTPNRQYYSLEDVATPDLVSEWTREPGFGDFPLPIVTPSLTTPTPPYLRVADGYLYVQDAGVWKKTALSTL